MNGTSVEKAAKSFGSIAASMTSEALRLAAFGLAFGFLQEKVDDV